MTSTATSILAIHCYGEKLEVAAFITRSMSKIVNQFELDLFVFDFHFLLHNSTQAISVPNFSEKYYFDLYVLELE